MFKKRLRSDFKLSIFGLAVVFMSMGLTIGMTILAPDLFSIVCSFISVLCVLPVIGWVRFNYLGIKAFDDEDD